MASKREMKAVAGYSVFIRSSHGLGPSWDWTRPGKGAMESRHFKGQEEAWADAEQAFDLELARARELLPMIPGYVRLNSGSGDTIGYVMAEAATALFIETDAMSVGYSWYEE